MNDLGREGTNCIAETVNNFIQSCKYFIAKSHFAQFFPDLFNRIHFRGMRRYEKQLNVFWNTEGSGLMLGSSITAQKNHIVWILP